MYTKIDAHETRSMNNIKVKKKTAFVFLQLMCQMFLDYMNDELF